MWHLKPRTLPVVIGALDMVAKTAPNCFTDPWSSIFNRTSKNNTHHGYHTYPVKGSYYQCNFFLSDIF